MPVSVFAVISVRADITKAMLEKAQDAIFQANKTILPKIGALLREIVVEKYLSGPRPGKLGRVTGALAANTTYAVGLSQNWVKVGNNLPYGPIHEFGGIVRPVKGQYLAIPIGRAKTKAGQARKASPRDFPNTFVQTSKQGALIIFQKRARSILPLFVLKKQVRIPARPYLSPALRDARPEIVDIAKQGILEAIRQSGFGSA